MRTNVVPPIPQVLAAHGGPSDTQPLHAVVCLLPDQDLQLNAVEACICVFTQSGSVSVCPTTTNNMTAVHDCWLKCMGTPAIDSLL